MIRYAVNEEAVNSVLHVFFIRLAVIQTFDHSNYQTICNELACKDASLAHILNCYGYPPLWQRPNNFETLVHIIFRAAGIVSFSIVCIK